MLIYNSQLYKCCEEDMSIVDNYYVCYNCASVFEAVINDNYIPSKDIKQKNPYIQKNHFRNKLLKLQGVDNTYIPNEVYEKLSKYEYNTINELQIILKSLKLSIYVKNIIIIDYNIKKRLIHDLNNKIIDKMLIMFDKIHNSYYEIVNKNRQLFNYNYLIFKLLMLFGCYDIAQNVFFFKKSNNTIQKYDEIWEYICEKNNYIYSSTNNDLKKININKNRN